jgi:hypothetical protein
VREREGGMEGRKERERKREREERKKGRKEERKKKGIESYRALRLRTHIEHQARAYSAHE